MDYRRSANRTFPVLVALIAIFCGTVGYQEWGNNRVMAQSDAPNPLETPVKDPLLPSIDRPLTPFEQRLLREALDKLNAEAKAELEAGNDEAAFTLWYRELKLRRAFGSLEEVKALGRVGEIAWEKTRTPDVKNITKRLVLVQQQAETQKAMNPELLRAFAQAYDQVGSIDNSLYIYQKILGNARLEKDLKTQETTLNTIGELHLSRFDYVNAAGVYEELLLMARSRSDSYREGIYLQTLSEIYSKALQPENSVKIKEQLADRYLQEQKIAYIPPLKILIADDYVTLKQSEKASQNYQEAYSLGLALQEFSIAAEALSKLGDLYRSYQQDDYALMIYQQLVNLEQKSYNYYGLMNAYDRIGQIYLAKKDYNQALTAFNLGLELARSISYRTDYFYQKIQEVNQEKNKQ